MVDEQRLRELISEHGLSQLAERILGHARPAIQILTRRLTDDDGPNPSPGSSRFGGTPDLPEGTKWPGSTRPLIFLAQLRLSDVPDLPGREGLPPRGMLWFFYDVIAGPWGFDPADRDRFAVVFSEEESGLVRTPHPPEIVEAVSQEFGEQIPYCACDTSFRPRLTVPGAESSWIRRRDIEPYIGLLESVYPPDMGETFHWIGGLPAEEQGDMTLDCQLASNDVYLGDDSWRKDPRAKKLVPGKTDWRLLLQIDTDEDGPGWMWGDCGRLYFWVRQQDLAVRDFSKVWCVLQCG